MRARNIKPGLFKNEILGAIDPLYSLLFVGLWLMADKNGVLEDRPLRIKGELFPHRESLEINRYLTELSRLGFIQRYTVDGVAYIHVTKFHLHQRPHHTEKSSKLPLPPIDSNIGCEFTVSSPLSNREYPPDSLIPDSLIQLPTEVDAPASEPRKPRKPREPKPKKPGEQSLAEILGGKGSQTWERYWKFVGCWDKDKNLRPKDTARAFVASLDRLDNPKRLYLAALHYEAEMEGRRQFMVTPCAWLLQEGWENQREAMAMSLEDLLHAS